MFPIFSSPLARSLSIGMLAATTAAGSLAAQPPATFERDGQNEGASQDAGAENLPDGRDLWKQALETMGGREAFEKIESGRYELEIEATTGTQSMQIAFHGDKFLLKHELPAGESIIGYDGELGWQSQTGQIPRPINQQQIREVSLLARLPIRLLDLDEHYDAMETIERTQLDDTDVWKVKLEPTEASPDDHDETFAFFEVHDGRWIGMLVRTHQDNGYAERRLRLTDFKTVSDITVFTKVLVTETAPNLAEPMEVTMELDTITFNAVDEAIFEPPPGFRDLHRQPGVSDPHTLPQ